VQEEQEMHHDLQEVLPTDLEAEALVNKN